MNKHFYLTLDTETCGSLKQPLVYDIGFTIHDKEDEYLFACNKWLLAHEETSEAKNGAMIAIKNRNIDIKEDIQ